MPQPPKRPAVGYNLQITKVTDLGGGQETITINTACEPDASPEALYGKIKLMRLALQKEIDHNRALEFRRQEQEAQQEDRARALLHAPGTRTPEDLPEPPVNGHDTES